MKDEMYELLQKFIKIKNEGFIKGVNNNNSGIGLTFEKMIGKKVENQCLPDYKGIEIKTRNHNSKNDISLFSASPEGGYTALKRLRDTYGYERNNDNYKILYTILSTTNYCYTYSNYYMKIEVDRKMKRINLITYDTSKKIVEIPLFWDLSKIYKMFYTKMKLLAIVNAQSKVIEGTSYYRYYSLDFYRYRWNDVFINLLEKGVIKIKLNLGASTNEYNYGELKDHGCKFSISIQDIERLYIKIQKKS